MRMLMITTAALAMIPATLAAQAGEGAGQARIDAALQSAARAEIPVSLLESKLKEGRAKGVPETRIAGVLETRLQSLIQARNAMRGADLGAMSSGELSVAADALQAGVSESALVEVNRRAPRERRMVATAVLGALVEMGVGSEQARMRVHEALGRGPQALANLHAEVAAQLRLRGRGHGGGGGGMLPVLEGVAGAAAGGRGMIGLGGGRGG